MTIESPVDDDAFDRSELNQHFALRETTRCHGFAKTDRWRPIWERQNLVTVEVRAGHPDDPTL